MKALTLIQPWASLVAMGVKRIETRSWQTSYRGVLAIHASKAYPRAARELAETPAFRFALRTTPRPLPRGMVIATCELRAIEPTAKLMSQYEFPWFVPGEISMLEQIQFGDFHDGRFAWELHEIRPMAVPIPAKGALCLWEWDGGPSQL